MYKQIPSKVDFPEVEKEVLAYWKEHKSFEKSLTLSKDEHVFYDGPPFPTGTPHHGTIFVSILKDAIARYFTMAGKTVPRRWGWDCHGLPIENAVEKILGVERKNEIEEKIGVKEFNRQCRKLVTDYNDSWESYINRIGRWVDYENQYRTLDPTYMESVLWVFKECYMKDLIYKDYRVTPYCYRCETPLSISDTRESDSTRPRQDPEVVVRFKADEDMEGKPTYFLAWTTTPWTLAANLALAVGEEYTYAAVEHEGNIYLIAKDLLPNFKKELGKKPVVVKTFTGKELVGKGYQPLLPYYADLKDQGYFRILSADFVTLTDGVGIVHMAPAFGEDDYWTCKRAGLSVHNPVDEGGRYTERVTDFAGRNVHEANKDVISLLKSRNQVIRHATLEHNYPHCWRCREPLIYRAMDAWYFAVEKIKDRLIVKNQEINWVPEHVKDGRFGKWLEGARDWNISRTRFWGTPIPVWECTSESCEERQVLGSFDEINAHSKTPIKDLHKEFLDEVTIDCSCGAPMKRVPDVLDCWFESGAMPYGQCHYPFENREWFESHFPADFIVEYPGQIRGWFYYLHVLAVALLDRPAFKNCLVHGTLLAADGSKISKSKKNYTDPMVLLDRYGADALRVYVLSSPAAIMQDLNFKDSGIEEQVKNVLLPLWNSYYFYITYANIDGHKGDPNKTPNPANPLDRWIMALLHDTSQEVAEAFSTYHLNRTLTPVLSFLENLTNWYIRRSRERFWTTESDAATQQDKQDAYDTLYYCLVALTRMLAPSAPFLVEQIHQNLTGLESIHHAKWPEVPESFRDPALRREVALARQITSLGLALRQKARLRVRQPLSAVRVALPRGIEPELLQGQTDVILDELNVKKLEFLADPSQLATIRGKPNAKMLGRKLGREMQQVIQAAREGNIREEGNNVVVFNDSKEWTLERNEIEIGYEGKEGCDVLSQDGVLVALNQEITPELKEEGIANDINRQIQELRKSADYAISDRIHLHLEGDLPDAWRQHLAEQALATLTPLSSQEADKEQTLEIDGRTFAIRIRRQG